jgi:hypothetical protein
LQVVEYSDTWFMSLCSICSTYMLPF